MKDLDFMKFYGILRAGKHGHVELRHLRYHNLRYKSACNPPPFATNLRLPPSLISFSSPMDSPTAFDSIFSPFPFFSLFLYNQLILLLVFLLTHRSLLLIRLKSVLGFFLSFFHPTHENIQVILVFKKYRNQKLFDSIRTYITYKLLPSAGGVVKITKPKHWRLDRDREIPDSFRGVPLKWVLRVEQGNGLIGRFRKSSRYFELCVPEKHLEEVRSLYLQSHVLEEATRIRQNNMILRRRWIKACVGWVNVIAGLVIQSIGCC